jgi:dienelactone hydrolase
VKRREIVAGSVIALLLAGIAARPYARGLSLIVRAANLHGLVRRAADLVTVAETERLVRVPVAHSAWIRGRVYTPSRESRQTVLLVSGLHPAGIDEPRLMALARELAETNVTVVTPEIAELRQFDITAALTDRIEEAALWLATQSGLAPSGRIGLMGISFSGGLSIVAAGRPSLRDHVSYVLSLGGHDSLPRVLRYLCTGIDVASTETTAAPRMTAPSSPHDYGVAIVLLGVADRLVPADQTAALRAGVRRFLAASALDQVDKAQAEREFAAVRLLAEDMPEPSKTLLGYVNSRDVAHLGPRLLPYIDFYGDAAPLSPSRSPKPSAPVFLLHGEQDNVIPAVESEYLAEDLRGQTSVRLLVTDLISHADVDQPARIGAVLNLGLFWADLLNR